MSFFNILGASSYNYRCNPDEYCNPDDPCNPDTDPCFPDYGYDCRPEGGLCNPADFI